MSNPAMSNYVRHPTAGRTYFFTINLADPSACTLCLEIDLLRECYVAVCNEMPFRTDTIVVLPNHLHLIWTLPEGDTDFSNRLRRIKATFTRGVRQKELKYQSPQAKRPSIWQPRFWDHAIRDQEDLEQHRAYCWSDPVRHGLVHDPMDWQLSSFSKRGIRLSEVGDLRFSHTFPTGEIDDIFDKAQRTPRATSVGAA